ncbi:MAG: ATP phosphoribosyltransferase regulatory subunit [Trichlorobacter sp.]|jgi:ATP phosphoribosyltransferase regulatory subunit|nr:ATP phosphoribosyltransferase regulatory subunit [Trichlorobacter sp.]
MPHPDSRLPRGVSDCLQTSSHALFGLEQIVRKVTQSWGFQQIVPPALEFEDVLAQGMGEELRRRSFRFDDWQTGRLLAIPPDITPQIARIAATRLKNLPMPYRLSYSGRVLRHTELQTGQSREIMQAGVELIGLDSPEADAEMIAMAVEIMQAAKLDDFKIALGQTAFCRGIFESSGLGEQALSELREAISRKDATYVADILQRNPVSEASAREIMLLPRLFGDIDLIEHAETVVQNKVSRQALANIKEVLAILELHGVCDYLTIDLGDIRGLGYHTGITFEGFVPGNGENLFSGGRYDGLMACFGLPAPATGFTFNLLNMLQAVEQQKGLQKPYRDFMLFNQAADRSHALKIGRSLRQLGYSVARDIIKRNLEASFEYARQNSIKYLLVITDDGGIADKTLKLIEIADRSEKLLSQAELWQHFPLQH